MNEPDTTVSLTEAQYEVLRLFRLLASIEEKTPSSETVMVNVNLIRRLVDAFYPDLDKPNGASAPREAAKS
jgi:hypothetical protein